MPYETVASEADPSGPPAHAAAPGARLTFCMLGTRGVPAVQGGVETHCEELAPRLAAMHPDARMVVLARRNHVPEERCEFKGVEVIALPAPSHPYFEAIAHTFLGVLYARFKLRARLVHIHAIGPGLMSPLAKLLGMKVVVTHHSRNYLHAKWNALARLGFRLGETCAAVFADQIIAVSTSLAAELREHYPSRAQKVHYIPNGAPTHFTSGPRGDDGKALLERLGVEPGGYILAVGRLTPEKGFHELIRAMREHDVPYKLVIAGRAVHEDDYSRELKSAASDKIKFAGYVAGPDLFALYKQARMFVLPSHQEGLPISALEAVAAGVPLLMSDIRPNTDLGLPEKHYFPVGDVEALAAKLSSSAEDLRFTDEHFLDQFDWDDVAHRTDAVYAEALGAAPNVGA